MSNGTVIDLQPAADVLNNLINKLSDAIGWIATHETLEKRALDTYVRGIEESDLPPLAKAAEICKAKKTLKEYCNQDSIYRKASNMMAESAKPEEIDEDWIAQFADKARLVSNQDFQILWAGVLAQECNKPGSIPKALLKIIEQMDRSMADAFMKVASCSVWYIENGRKRYAPLIYYSVRNNEYCAQLGLCYEDLLDLESVGLVKIGNATGPSSYNRIYSGTIHYFNKEASVYPLKGEMAIGHVEYTKAGEALCAAVKPDEIEDFLKKYVRRLMAGLSLQEEWSPENP